MGAAGRRFANTKYGRAVVIAILEEWSLICIVASRPARRSSSRPCSTTLVRSAVAMMETMVTATRPKTKFTNRFGSWSRTVGPTRGSSRCWARASKPDSRRSLEEPSMGAIESALARIVRDGSKA